MPYPLKNLVKLDYCWKINATMMRESIFLAIPITGTYFIWSNMPQVWKFNRKTMPWNTLGMNLFVILGLINAVNISYSLIFEDYCKRNSKIYDVRARNAKVLRGLIADTNQNEKKTISGKSKTSLSD